MQTKQLTVKLAAVTAITLLNFGAIGSAHAGYWVDSQKQVVINDFGECWQDQWQLSDEDMLAFPQCSGKIPQDSDKDGVMDGADLCPDTPTGSKVDEKGCTIPEPKPVVMDTDKDGVVDNSDRCPDTPPGVKVNAIGCELDSDADGVVDSKDKCPNSLAGTNVDDEGCTLPIILKGASFKTGSSELTEDAKHRLHNTAMTLASNPTTYARIEGHTDSQGNASYNEKLSFDRANTVKAYLIDQGVKADHLEVIGYGEARPMASNDTEAGRRLNRRVEIHTR